MILDGLLIHRRALGDCVGGVGGGHGGDSDGGRGCVGALPEVGIPRLKEGRKVLRIKIKIMNIHEHLLTIPDK